MALLSKKKQVVIATEAIAGVTPVNGLTTPANADILLDSAEPSFEIDFIDREFLRDTITKIKSIPGQKTGGISMSFELSGNIDDTLGSGVPAWSRLLENSGFRLAVISKVAIAAAAWTVGVGPLRHGETITDETVGTPSTATLVGDVHEGDAFLYFELESATMAPSAAWTSGDTGVTFSTVGGTVIPCGWAWVPVSEPTKTVAVVGLSGATSVGAVYRGDLSGSVLVIAESTAIAATSIIFRSGAGAVTTNETLTLLSGSGPATISVNATDAAEAFVNWPSASMRLNEDGVAVDFLGSRSSVTFEFEVNRPVKVNVTSRGRWQAVSDAPTISSTAQLIDPKLWAGGITTIAPNEGLGDETAAGDRTACFKSLSLDMGVTLADVKCAHAAEGLLEIVGSERAASGSVTVNATAEAQIPWLGAFRSGEVNRLRVAVGGDVNFVNGFLFQVPSAQTNGASTGDEDGTMTRQIDFSMNAGIIDNLGASPEGRVFSTRGDNELAIFYIIS